MYCPTVPLNVIHQKWSIDTNSHYFLHFLLQFCMGVADLPPIHVNFVNQQGTLLPFLNAFSVLRRALFYPAVTEIYIMMTQASTLNVRICKEGKTSLNRVHFLNALPFYSSHVIYIWLSEG